MDKYGDIHEADDEGTAARKLVESGTEIAGAAVGGAIGLFGGPPGVVGGAVAGAVATRALKEMASEIRHRILGPREEKRVGATLAFAADRIRERLEAGDEVRTDGFFDAGDGGRSSGDEVAEGVLIIAQREAQERKLKFLGNLLANVAFDPTIDRDHANVLMRLAEDLSYRQFLVLAVNLKHQRGLEQLEAGDESAGDYAKTGGVVLSEDFRQELYDLYVLGLVGPEESAGFWLGPQNVYPFVLEITAVGLRLAELLGLDDAPTEDVKATADLLGWG